MMAASSAITTSASSSRRTSGELMSGPEPRREKRSAKRVSSQIILPERRPVAHQGRVRQGIASAAASPPGALLVGGILIRLVGNQVRILDHFPLVRKLQRGASGELQDDLAGVA